MTLVKIQSIERKLYVTVDNKSVEVKQIDSVDNYPKSTVIYTKDAVKGSKAGTPLYCVAVDDFIPKVRVSSKVATANTVESMLASGMTADDIIATLRKVQ